VIEFQEKSPHIQDISHCHGVFLGQADLNAQMVPLIEQRL
jgi:hypothetical protein